MPDDEVRRKWIADVLGVTLPPVGAAKAKATPVAKPAAAPDLLGLWQQARDSVASQVQGLQRRLAAYDDEELAFIGENANQAVMSTVSVKLATLLFEGAGIAEAKRAKYNADLRKQIAASRSALASNKLVGLLDTNPFGAALSIQATLGAALTQMEQSLAAS